MTKTVNCRNITINNLCNDICSVTISNEHSSKEKIFACKKLSEHLFHKRSELNLEAHL